SQLDEKEEPTGPGESVQEHRKFEPDHDRRGKRRDDRGKARACRVGHELAREGEDADTADRQVDPGKPGEGAARGKKGKQHAGWVEYLLVDRRERRMTGENIGIPERPCTVPDRFVGKSAPRIKLPQGV